MDEEKRTILDQLEEAMNGLKKLKEFGPPGEGARVISIALTHVETAILWLLADQGITQSPNNQTQSKDKHNAR